MKNKKVLISLTISLLCLTSCSNFDNKFKKINLKFKNDEIISLKKGYKKF